MIATETLTSLQSKITSVTISLAGSIGLSVVLFSSIAIVSILSLVLFVPQATFAPNIYFENPTNVTPIDGLFFDTSGNIKMIISVNLTSDDTAVQAGGEAVELIEIGTNATVQLRTANYTAGEFIRATITPTSEGLNKEVASGGQIPSDQVLHAGGTAEDAFEAEIITTTTTPYLQNHRVHVHSITEFVVDDSTPGVRRISLVPSPVQNTTCLNPSYIEWGDGSIVLNCTDGPALGVPNGLATLGPDGKILFEQLPQTFTADFLGVYDPITNQPALSNASCTVGLEFYYVAEFAGSVSLGSVTTLNNKDILICYNGTWSKVMDLSSALGTLFGRGGSVVPQLGDITPPLIPVNNGTLEDVEDGVFALHAASSVLSTSAPIVGATEQISATGAYLQLGNVSLHNGVGTTYNTGVRNAQFNRKAQLVGIGASTGLVFDVDGTAGEIFATGTSDIVLSLGQDIHPAANVTYGAVYLSWSTFPSVATGVIASGSGEARIPAGNGRALMDGINTGLSQTEIEGISGYKTFLLSPLITAISLQFYPTANKDNGATMDRPTGMTSNIVSHAPPTPGVSGQQYSSDGTNDVQWQNAPNVFQWTSYTPTISAAGGGTQTLIAARYRGALTVGEIIEVEVRYRITTIGTPYSTSTTCSLPFGNVAAYSFPQGRIRGFLSGQTSLGFTGFVQDGFSANQVIFAVQQGNYPLTMDVYATFHYVVA